MLEAGLTVDSRSQHNATALHWASWHGNAELVQAILTRNPPLEDANNDFQATPLGWTLHGSQNGWHRETGDYATTVEALLEAGARPPQNPDGSEDVLKVFCNRGLL
jgi:ankyrin repeat protein